ncbi:MMPL family transporter [Streptomyces anthocyanicus]|uniref:MMPL family transporter n=1 Tax=Streptomyces anthocyanicus TaxID=68174 RepID=UPI002F91BD0F
MIFHSGRGGRRGRGPWVTLFAGLLFLIVAGVCGVGVLDNLKSGGFDDPDSDSVAATAVLERNFPESQPNLVIMVEDAAQGVDSPRAEAVAGRVVERVTHTPGAKVVASYYGTGDPALRSGHAALLLVRISGDENKIFKITEALHDRLSSPGGAVSVSFGGVSAVNYDMYRQVEKDIVSAETIVVPVTLLLLVLVFRGVVAALLPVLLAVLTVAGSTGIVNLLARFTSVSVFAINLITALGLGLAVDYSLLTVTRYREERARGRSNAEALEVTRATAGRTVFISGCVVGAALAALLLFDQYFLRSFAFAGIVVVLLSVSGALVLLPPALTLLGDRIDALSWKRRTTPPGAADTAWGRIAGLSYRRPLLLAVPLAELLATLILPLGHSQFGVPDQRALPARSESRVVTDAVRQDFGAGEEAALNVVVTPWSGTPSELAAYATALSRTDGVSEVVSAAGVFKEGVRAGRLPSGQTARFDNGTATWLQVQTNVVPYSSEGSDLARAVRGVEPPAGSHALVGGPAAQVTDINQSIAEKLPLALVLIVVISFLFLFLLTGSVVQPVRALLLNLLTLMSILGVSVYIFQDGHLSGVLDFTAAPIAVSMPVLVFCIAFGLSMDYEVFLIARIKESYDRMGDLPAAVREGLGASGPVITAAAAVLAVSFLALTTSGVSLVKLYGVATGLAILIDAIVIRGALVPASLRITGRFSWWAPSWARAVHRRFGIRESAGTPAHVPASPEGPTGPTGPAGPTHNHPAAVDNRREEGVGV